MRKANRLFLGARGNPEWSAASNPPAKTRNGIRAPQGTRIARDEGNGEASRDLVWRQVETRRPWGVRASSF